MPRSANIAMCKQSKLNKEDWKLQGNETLKRKVRIKRKVSLSLSGRCAGVEKGGLCLKE
jgi:hypothetical protein